MNNDSNGEKDFFYRKPGIIHSVKHRQDMIQQTAIYTDSGINAYLINRNGQKIH